MFQFTEDCRVGVEQIDTEHQYLFMLIDQIGETVKNQNSVEMEQADLQKHIDDLIEYGNVHFKHEEAYMEKIGDSELLRQKRDHAMFLAKIRGIDLQDLNDAEKKIILEDTLLYLTRWLYQHILGSDTLIGKVRHIADETGTEEDFCKFTDKYLTGIGEIDEEHRVLFDIIGKAYRLLERESVVEKYDEIMGVLDELDEYAGSHFFHEEQYMEKIGYPSLELQRGAHMTFMERLEDRDLGENMEDQQIYLEELLDFLFAWLGNHIMKMDKLIGEWERRQ